MDAKVSQALALELRRIETWFYRVDGVVGARRDLDEFVAASPLFAITFD